MKFSPAGRLILAAVFGMLAVPGHAQSLADAMVDSYRHSALMDQNRAVLRAADEDVASAVARLRPVLQWTAGHTYREVQGIESATTTLSLGAEMTLYDWGRGALAVDRTKEAVLAARAGLVGVEQDVLLTATSAWFQVRQAMEQVALQSNSVRVIQQERQAAQDRFDVGEITLTDVSLADARLAAARAQQAAAAGQLEVAREVFRGATGDTAGDLAAPPRLPDLPDSVDGARGIAQRTHPAIRQAQHQAAASELAVASAVAERNPIVRGNAGISAQRAPDSRTGRGNVTGGTSVGIEMSQTLYSGGLLSSQHRQAMAQRDQARAGLLQVSRQVSEAVGTAWANIAVARAQIGAIDQQISAAQQAYDGVREEVTLGARTTLDVLDAEQSLLEARADRITAEANLQLAHYQLLAAMGLLTVENLKLGIPTYYPTEYYNAVRDAPFTSRQGENLDRVLRAIGKGD